MSKLKKESIGKRVFVPHFSSMIIVSEDNAELFRKLGHVNLFEDDDNNKPKRKQRRSTNTRRVSGPDNTEELAD